MMFLQVYFEKKKKGGGTFPFPFLCVVESSFLIHKYIYTYINHAYQKSLGASQVTQW